MVRPSRWTDELTAEAIRLRKVEGLTSVEIGRRMGMSKGQIVGKFQRLGVLTPPRDYYTKIDKQPQLPRSPLPSTTPANDGCRFPMWDHQEQPDHRFCGAPVLVRQFNGAERNESYCSEHWALTHIAVTYPEIMVAE